MAKKKAAKGAAKGGAQGGKAVPRKARASEAVPLPHAPAENPSETAAAVAPAPAPDPAPAPGAAESSTETAAAVAPAPAPAPAPASAPPVSAASESRDWSTTLFLPKTAFSMKAGLPDLEPRLLQRWADIGLYEQLRARSAGRAKFVLHDGPPYANGNIHIGHALNKILKDLVVKSQQMLGFDSNYVPGWDCHGLPIEWKIEEQYRAKGKNKDEVPVNEFRKECREFAAHWLAVQREEFKRLGVVGDWDNPYSTMSFPAEATIARELMKFARSGLLYRGSKPVMWSVVEKTALAEAEVEYLDYQSDQIWVKFPLVASKEGLYPGTHREEGDIHSSKEVSDALMSSSIVIWTTTPWTIPGNRAVSYSNNIHYSVFEVTEAPEGNWATSGDRFVLADKLAEQVMKAAKVTGWKQIVPIRPADLGSAVCAHPLRGQGYDFDVPLLDGDHVTDDAGTGFVHTAPGHGTDDYSVWTSHWPTLETFKIDRTVPFTVDADGVFTEAAPGFTGKRVLKENGDKGDANDAVIKALTNAGMMIARGRLKHQYPHSWRSKKPVIFRNTPQWFIALDKPFDLAIPNEPRGDANPAVTAHSRHRQVESGWPTLRKLALAEIKATQWVPDSGQNRITGMIENRPDWVVSRQRAWGVPIAVFRNTETEAVIPGPDFAASSDLTARIVQAFAKHGADVWFEEGAKERFLKGLVPDDELANWEQVRDVLDVWFDSGSTHAFTLEDPSQFPGLAGVHRVRDGGQDRVMYLEGSDQHRGWFHSSLLESCGTRGFAPYDIVLTHGFILDEKGEDKMSKSKGNALSPQEVMKISGADILRLWVASADTTGDIRFGPAIVQAAAEAYRKLRNTLRWMLGALTHFEAGHQVPLAELPELERLMLHRLAELSDEVREAYAEYEYRKVVSVLSQFMNSDLSAFYFDIRKDTLYCEAYSSAKRRAALTVIDQIFGCCATWLAPILSFTSEEAWLVRYPSERGSVHLAELPAIPDPWRDDGLAAKWEKVRDVRRVVTGALELERAAKRIGSSLEAAPRVYVEGPELIAALAGVDFAEVCITSAIEVVAGSAPEGAFRMPDVGGVGVVPARAEGRKCARSWRITADVGTDASYPDLSARDAAAVAEFDLRNKG